MGQVRDGKGEYVGNVNREVREVGLRILEIGIGRIGGQYPTYKPN